MEGAEETVLEEEVHEDPVPGLDLGLPEEDDIHEAGVGHRVVLQVDPVVARGRLQEVDQDLMIKMGLMHLIELSSCEETKWKFGGSTLNRPVYKVLVYKAITIKLLF